MVFGLSDDYFRTLQKAVEPMEVAQRVMLEQQELVAAHKAMTSGEVQHVLQQFQEVSDVIRELSARQNEIQRAVENAQSAVDALSALPDEQRIALQLIAQSSSTISEGRYRNVAGAETATSVSSGSRPVTSTTESLTLTSNSPTSDLGVVDQLKWARLIIPALAQEAIDDERIRNMVVVLAMSVVLASAVEDPTVQDIESVYTRLSLVVAFLYSIFGSPPGTD